MQQYEVVIGLEVHLQLSTNTKLFCSDATKYGAQPNTQVSPVSLAHPGTLPALNKEAVVKAVKLALALSSKPAEQMHFDRKHYFYPDLPKGFQTSQLTHPVCEGGSLPIYLNNQVKNVAIHHVHMEEDAGKSLHDVDETFSCIDLNRAGTPLLELVTEPVIRSSEEAAAFMTALRRLVQWLGVCDGNMEEGSLRADANVSIRPVGEKKLGTRVEIKNLNSIRFLRRAIDAEVLRQEEILRAGGKVEQETRGYDSVQNITLGQRSKEEANDYRYFPCPDLPPFTISKALVDEIKTNQPALPWQLQHKFENDYGLSENEAAALSADKRTADFLEEIISNSVSSKQASNWLLGPIKNWQNENADSEFPLQAKSIASLIKEVEKGGLSFQQAAGIVMPKMISEPSFDIPHWIASLGLTQERNSDELEKWIDAAISAMPEKVDAYRKGKKGLLGLFVAEVKKLSKGKADAKMVSALLEEKLK